MGEGKIKYSKLIWTDILQNVSAFKSIFYVMFIGYSLVQTPSKQIFFFFLYVMMKNPQIRVSHSRKGRCPEYLQWLHPRLTQLRNCWVHLLFFRQRTPFFTQKIADKRAGQLSRYSDWLRAGRSWIESQWRRDFPPVQTGPGNHPASWKMGIRSFPRVEAAAAWGRPPSHI